MCFTRADYPIQYCARVPLFAFVFCPIYICLDILKVSLVWICYYHHLLLPVGLSPSLATLSVVTFNILSTYEVGVGT